MSSHRIEAPESISDLISKAEERGRRMERVDIAYEVGIYDLHRFCYDPRNQEEVLRLRDSISEYILKGRA